MKKYDNRKKQKIISPKKNFKKTIECKTCDEEFKVTLKKNIIKDEVLVLLRRDSSKTRGFLTDHLHVNDYYEQATRYKSVCPSCNYKEKMFLVLNIPQKVKVKGRDHYY